ncbi:MAG: hypothetical protein E4H36_01000 [Spirochaetales bacterium]|nr:MAG: hypothetical protein E4H36_01000 [Spirochaetales bacterium]
MKKILLIILIIGFLSAGVFAQTQDFNLDDMKTAFQGFITSVADALPMATTVGLQWSDAYIGQFPVFGVGLAVGAALIPLDKVLPAFEPLGVPTIDLPIPQELSRLIGFPFPAWAFDARLGGIIIPFDVGFKIGFIPPVVRDKLTGILPAGLSYDYLLIGGDIRIPLIKSTKGAFRPNLSIGGGYTYYRGAFTFSLPAGTDPISFTLPDPSDPLTTVDYTYKLSDPEINLFWDAHVIDLKAQFSLKLLWLLTPYIGVGGSYARANAGGGLVTQLLDGNDNVVDPATDPTLQYIKEALTALGQGQEALFSASGFNVASYVNGWSFRAYGGLSVNLWLIKIDASIMYNFIDGSLGAMAGLRIQL